MVDRLIEIPAPLRLLVTALAGATGALGQAPYDHPAAMVLSLTAGFCLWRIYPKSAAITGWAFGAGYFAAALVWIVEPFQIDAARHGWMAPFALLFLSAGLALFWGAAFWAAQRLGAGSFGLVLTWTGAEIVRAYIFTGFPWAAPAQVTIEGAVSVLLAWVGPHGATFALLSFACALASLGSVRALALRSFAQGGLLGAGLLVLYLPLAQPPAALSEFWVRLVQPNAAQHLKWQPEMAEVFFQRQLSLTSTPPQGTAQLPDLIVWPETAIPWLLESQSPALAEIAHAANSVPVALGGLRTQQLRLRNSLAVLGADGTINALYDKHHLVPFGEYIPFASTAERLGLRGLAATMGGFDRGPGPVLLDFGELGKAMPLICYESVFAHGVNAAPGRADFILQVTNDAWFGQYAGPQQHLAQARMRAIEQGLPVIRAANTGISAMIDPFGRIVAALPLNRAGLLDAPLPLPLRPTLYTKFGDFPAIMVVLLGMIGAVLARRRKRRRVSD